MFEDPVVAQRRDQPYVALNASIRMDGFGVLDGLFARVAEWLGERGVEAAGLPFVRYLVIDMDNLLDIQAAVPVEGPVVVEGDVVYDVLPGGSYVTLEYVASRPAEHIAANAHLQEWTRERGYTWKNTCVDGVERWGGRIEVSASEESASGREMYAAYLIND